MEITALDYANAVYASPLLPGKNYVTGTPKAASYYDGAGTGAGCNLTVNGVTGKLIYTGTTTKKLEVTVNTISLSNFLIYPIKTC